MSGSKCKICGGPCGSVCKGLGFGSSDKAGSRVEDKPRPYGASLQQGAATSSKPAQREPRVSDKLPRGKGSAAANVAKPQTEPASALPQSPVLSEAKPKFDRNTHHRNYMREYMRRR